MKNTKRKPRRLGRYEQAITTAAFKKAYAKARDEFPDKKACIHGHTFQNPEAGNIDVGVLLREGTLACRTCWATSQSAYEKRLAKKANRRKK